MSFNDKDIVSALVAALSAHLGAQRYTAWFGRNVEFQFDGSALKVLTPDAFYVDWLRTNYRELIAEICQQIGLADVAVQFALCEVVKPPAAEECAQPLTVVTPPADADESASGTAVLEPPKARAEANSGRRRFAQFATFVVGESNRVGYTAAQIVAREPGRVTPLVLYGPPGTGKTHLLEALWSELRISRPQAHLIYQRAEQFTSQFVEALRGSGMPAFRRKYRHAQLLILDDLQFFSNKRATLDELLYTIDQLQDSGGQVVLAADRSPSELTCLGPELASRLQGSMVCRIDPADEATRRAIMRRVADRQGLELGDEVEAFIAARLRGDGRELIGAIHRLRVEVEATGRAIDVEMARTTLAELFVAAQRPVQLPEIEQAICEVCGVRPADLQSSSRAKEATYPRMLAMYLARKLTTAAFSEIGAYFGQRKHTTVISATNKVALWRETNEIVRLGGASLPVDELVRRVEARLRAG
ncbi:MAG: chromosomal replication initiator protein DnaA [Pirellulales bacterium]|nr:chromosomal replication initiator protein DnaA [Pirellulales bacterium]